MKSILQLRFWWKSVDGETVTISFTQDFLIKREYCKLFQSIYERPSLIIVKERLLDGFLE